MAKFNFLIALSILLFTSVYAQKLENVDISKVTSTVNRTIQMNSGDKDHVISVNRLISSMASLRSDESRLVKNTIGIP